MNRTDSRTGLIYLIITIFLFSTFEVTTKFVSPYMRPVQITFIRFFIGGLVLLPPALFRIRKNRIRLKAGDLARFALLGVVNIVLSMGCIQLGLVTTNASVGAILFSTNPLFVMIFSRFMLKEKITPPKVAGLLLGFLGMSLLLTDSLSRKTSTPLGLVLILASAVFFGFYTVLGKKIITRRVDSLIINAFSFLAGSLVLVPVQLVMKIRLIPQAAPVLPHMLYLSVIVTGLAYVFYFEGLSRLEASAGSMVFFAKPALASLLAVLILHEQVGPKMILGILVTAGGILAAQLNPEKKSSGKKRTPLPPGGDSSREG